MSENKDYLDELIEENVKNDPEFAVLWPTMETALQLTELRVKLGLTQQEIAVRMNVRRERVASIEAHPESTKFEAIVRYACALGAKIQIVSPKAKSNPVERPAKVGRKPSSKRLPMTTRTKA